MNVIGPTRPAQDTDQEIDLARAQVGEQRKIGSLHDEHARPWISAQQLVDAARYQVDRE